MQKILEKCILGMLARSIHTVFVIRGYGIFLISLYEGYLYVKSDLISYFDRIKTIFFYVQFLMFSYMLLTHNWYRL